MAELGLYEDKLLQDGQDPNQQQGGAAANTFTGSGTSGVVSGAGNSDVSTAGIGAGGAGGWTNIQAYLGANKGDTGSSQSLQDKASSQYQTENDALNTSAQDAQSKAAAEANKIKDAKDNSKSWVNQAASAYSWDGQQGDDYNSNVNKLKDARTSQYAGPNSYAYGTSADFQGTNAALNDDNAFSNYMAEIYKNKAGGQLNAGQTALQSQLDVNNQALADTRSGLKTQYSGFGDVVKGKVTETDAAIKKAREDFGNNQNSLSAYLQNLGNEYDTGLNQAEINARSGYSNTLENEASGRSNSLLHSGLFNSGTAEAFAGKGLPLKEDLKWGELEKENKFGKDASGVPITGATSDYGDYRYLDRNPNQLPIWNTFNDYFHGSDQALNNFYNQQDDKYKNTGDSEKKNWNTIMDILGNSERKQQGFQVRG